jgi:hypothetical protein
MFISWAACIRVVNNVNLIRKVRAESAGLRWKLINSYVIKKISLAMEHKLD